MVSGSWVHAPFFDKSELWHGIFEKLSDGEEELAPEESSMEAEPEPITEEVFEESEISEEIPVEIKKKSKKSKK